MRLLVIENSHVGHRFPYLRMLLPALCELSDQVTLAIPKDSVDTDEYRSQLSQFEDRLRIDPWLPSHAHRAVWHKPAEVRAAISRSHADYVYVPHADGYAQVIGLRQSLGLPTIPDGVEAEGLLMRGAFAYPQPGLKASAQAALSIRLSMHGPWDRLHLLDPLVYNAMKARGGAATDHLSLLPDPVPTMLDVTRTEARQRLGLPEAGRYVVSAGALDGRKGTDLLLRAFKQAKLADSDRLLLAGRLAPDMRKLVDRECREWVASDRMIVLDRFISDEEFNLAITAADVVCTPYRRHIGSASIAIRAASAERFVLASDYGWLGHIVPQFDLGRVCDVESINVLSSELTTALDDASCHTWGESARRFAAFHSEANFVATWTARLRERLGKPCDEQRMTWDKVMESVNEE